ncbi:4'-phosphopantetheinyl transferase [Streptomyces yangpuensis]|uniref:4'-phosphopantetheinyl transferase family protein n=1 Tax=Streptomyces yangpuensis TaxID=1648182 RepID=UPI0037126757
MLQTILPPKVRLAQSFSNRADITLFPQEAAVVANSVRKRKDEFTTVRACAREALRSLGYPPVPLLPGERGAPIWPAEVVGSMTHCPGYRAAVVARQSEVMALGIDAEPNVPLPDGVLAAIARPEELAVLKVLPAGGGTAWDRVLFSAKESVYKAWFPLTRRFLDFQDATVTIAPDGTFTSRILAPGPIVEGRPLPFEGRWTVSDGLVTTATVVERTPLSQ